MSSGKKILAAVIALVIIIGGFAFIHSRNKPASSEGTKSYTLEVVADKAPDDSAAHIYEGKTDAEYLSELMDELQAQGDFSYEGSETEYGLFISTVNGLTADYDKDGAYWSIIVNGEYGQYGADSQVVSDGDSFKLVYETAQ